MKQLSRPRTLWLAAWVFMAAVLIGAFPGGGAAGPTGRERLLVVAGAGPHQVADVYDGRGRLLHTVYGPADAALTWSPNGKMLAITSRAGVWVERANGSGKRQLVSITTSCRSTCQGLSVAWTPDGKTLAVGGVDPHRTGFELIDVATGRVTLIGKQRHYVFYSPIAFSPNGRWLAYAFSSGNVGTTSCCVEELVVSRADGTHPRVLHQFGDPIHDGPTFATWSPDSTRIAYTDDGESPKDPRLAIVDVRSGRMRALNPRHVYDQYPAWSPNARRLALTQYAAPVFTVATDGSHFHPLQIKGTAALWLRDGDLLIAVGKTRHQTETSHRIERLPGARGKPRMFVTLPGHQQLLRFQAAR